MKKEQIVPILTAFLAHRMRSLVLPVAAMAILSAGGAKAVPPASWQALVSPAGAVHLERGGRDIGSLEPGLFEAVWRGASLSPGKPGATAPADGVRRGQIRAPGGALVETELRTVPVANGLRLAYRLTPQKELALNSLHVSLAIPVNQLAGGRYAVDGEQGVFPAQFQAVALRAGAMRSLDLIFADGARLRFRFAAPTPVLLQDDRQWGPTFTIRIGPQMDGASPWPAGKALALEFTLTAGGGMKVDDDGPVTIAAGAEWLPLDSELEIEPGSALDFSDLTPWHAPAGKFGRVLADKKGRMVFADRPEEPVRFYGVNLCFSAQFLSHAQSDRLAERLRRLGYNAVRLHHYEWELVDRSQGTSTRLNPEALDRLDYLFYALKRRGLYITTDLYVSRPVFAREVWEGADGDVGMDEFKMAVPVNERAFANFRAFTAALLDHVNPYTKTRWADDPALAWLSLINEGNPGNFLHLLNGRLKEDYARAWNRWLTTRQADHEAQTRLASGQDSAKSDISLPLHDDGSANWLQFNLFLAENQRAFFERTRAFLRDELGCQALLTNLNAWTNPAPMHSVRAAFDYVDDHFYVDHPEFLEQPWQLPSRCPNTSPVAQGAPGGRGGAFLRLFDRPFTISEFNYSGPGRFRGVGGILTGALGAVQDWSVLWRFAYSHNRDNLFTPGTAGYFDMATDPLSLASERASLCLFRRGDMRPAPHSVAIAMTPEDARKGPKSARSAIPGWNGLALVTRVGSLVTSDPAQASGVDLLLPLGWATPADAWRGAKLDADPYAPEAGEKVLAALRERGWLPADNVTDLRMGRFQSETGELTVDAPADVLTLDTPRTSGGYAPAGKKIETKAVTISIKDTDATVWVSSLDDAPIAGSRRLLVTHLTDLQNAGARYADKGRRTLLEWGGLPHLVRKGRATVTIRMKEAAKARVWGLATGGKRLEQIPARVVEGALVVPLDVDRGGKARMLYEIEVAP